jgi:hypothetical protein
VSYRIHLYFCLNRQLNTSKNVKIVANGTHAMPLYFLIRHIKLRFDAGPFKVLAVEFFTGVYMFVVSPFRRRINFLHWSAHLLAISNYNVVVSIELIGDNGILFVR